MIYLCIIKRFTEDEICLYTFAVITNNLQLQQKNIWKEEGGKNCLLKIMLLKKRLFCKRSESEYSLHFLQLI